MRGNTQMFDRCKRKCKWICEPCSTLYLHSYLALDALVIHDIRAPRARAIIIVQEESWCKDEAGIS